MSTPAPEKIFPKTDGPPAPAGGPRAPGGFKLDKKVAMWGGAVAVALIALVSSRSQGGAQDDETGGGAYELDTTETDVYGDLQPELENIADAIETLGDDFEDFQSDKPKAATPKPATPKPRTTNKPAPKKKKKPGRPKATPKKPAPKKKKPAPKRKIPSPRQTLQAARAKVAKS